MIIQTQKKLQPQLTHDLNFILSLKKDKRETRRHIKFVYVDNNNIVSTNGHELRAVKNDYCFHSGFYETLKKTKSEIVLQKIADAEKNCFPDYEKMINSEGIPFIKNVIENAESSFSLAYAYLSKDMLNFDKFVNIERFLNICKGIQDASIFWAEKTPAIFINHTKKAALMPMCV